MAHDCGSRLCGIPPAEKYRGANLRDGVLPLGSRVGARREVCDLECFDIRFRLFGYGSEVKLRIGAPPESMLMDTSSDR